MNLWCDRFVISVVFFLILFTPLAFGSVHPWAFATVEVLVFLTVIVWMTKLTFVSRSENGETDRRPKYLSYLCLPIALFIAFVAFQLVPLPPPLLRFLSPSTYELYQKSLLGWPEKRPYEDLIHSQRTSSKSSGASAWTLLPTADEIRRGARVPFAENKTTAESRPASRSFSSPSWLPISIAPSLTRTDLLKFIAYACLFLLVLLYPLGGFGQRLVSPDETRRLEVNFARSILLMVLFSGLIVAALGIVQTFSWNGKILGFFEPYDRGIPGPGQIPRASGPFVNPDHFANYLLLIFPLAVSGAIFRTSIMPKRVKYGIRIFCGFAAFILFSGILLSLSRAAWIGVLLEVGILFWFFSRVPEEGKPLFLQKRGSFFLCYALIAVCTVFLTSLLFVGPGGRKQVDIRLEETVLQNFGLWGRASIWRETLEMVKDFPILGVGLGSWPELFPRYKSPPWSSNFYRETHNDYLELLAETGIVGFGLLAWFFWQAGRRLFGSLGLLAPKTLPVFASLLSALGGMAFHEFFDFNLQIPANALLFTLFLALSLRMTSSALPSLSPSLPVFRFSSPLTFVPISIGAFILLYFALNQERVPYPHNLKVPASVSEGREFILSHPARSSAHLSLLRTLENKAPHSWQVNVFEVALWLDPTNPYIRDLFASLLLRIGRKEEGLEHITLSVFHSPSLSTHFYLSERILPWLSVEEHTAIEKGFKKAVYQQPAVINDLASFYTRLGRFSDEGILYEEAAQRFNDSVARATYVINAGLAYVRARKDKIAEDLFYRATFFIPEDPRPYHHLVTLIYGPQKELSRAKATISQGIKNGADPFSLYLSLAEAGHKAGNPEEANTALGLAKSAVHQAVKKGRDAYSLSISLAEVAGRIGNTRHEKEALLEALNLRASASEIAFRLGHLYLQESDFDRAALYFRKAGNINPRFADAFFQLALAEEGRYRFAAAGKAYGRAVELAPKHAAYRERYDAFKHRVAETRKANSTKPTGQPQ